MSQYTQPDPLQPGPPVGYPQQVPPPAARNGLGIAALILGVIGVISGLIPFMFWLAGILGVIALILGLVGRGRAKRGQATNKGMATSGAVLALIALGLSIWGLVTVFMAVDDAVKELDKATSSVAPAEPGTEKSKPKDDGASGEDAKSDTEGTGASAADFKKFVAAKGTAQEKDAVAHVTKIQGAEEQNDILDSAEIFTDYKGDIISNDAGDAKLIASAFADWKQSDNGLVTIYNSAGELLANGKF